MHSIYLFLVNPFSIIAVFAVAVAVYAMYEWFRLGDDTSDWDS